ncbi:hypothetical protein [Pontibacter pamirensis]|uniref:hypothetical protein n=1 Tax=Pontibacter pamirensis TaxID=2562824 RepID=UPI001389D27A|nr:hypothetical protein [Pontibacter pamirensis]
MEETLQSYVDFTLRTECGKMFENVFKAIKLVRDEKHNFHIVYKTFSDEYIYSFCNPFLDEAATHTYTIISESEARNIFLPRLSQENASELFSTAKATPAQLRS